MTAGETEEMKSWMVLIKRKLERKNWNASKLLLFFKKEKQNLLTGCQNFSIRSGSHTYIVCDIKSSQIP
jgi:hypothetical protein